MKNFIFLSASSAGIFLAPVSRTCYPLIPDHAMNFPGYKRQFLCFTHKGDNQDSLFVHSCTFFYFFISFSQSSGLIIVLLSMLKSPNKISASSALYMLKYFDVCFNLWVLIDYDSDIFPSHILLFQVSLVRILTPPPFLIIFVSFLKYVLFLPNFLVRLHPMMPTP